MRHAASLRRSGEDVVRSGKRSGRQRIGTTIGTLSTGTAAHIVKVTITNGLVVEVDPDPLAISAGESVEWRFYGVPNGKTPEIRFAVSADQPKAYGPFSGVLQADNFLEGVTVVYTLTGWHADTRPYRYKYDAGTVNLADGLAWEGVDPIIDNDGKPPQIAPAKPTKPDHGHGR